MATSIVPDFADTAQGRVVRRLVGAAAPAPAPAPKPTVAVGPARSPFWQNRIDTLDTERRQLSELKVLKGDISSIDKAIGGLRLPTSFSVTTQMSATDAELLRRSVTAAEQLADNTRSRTDSCVSRGDMSDLAYTVIARLTTLAVPLMDRRNVTLDSVLARLGDPTTRTLVADVGRLLAGTPAANALVLLSRAVDLQPFEQWQKAGAPQDDPRLFAELNRRAALLLAAKCEVAATASGAAPDWPPVPKAAPTPGTAAATPAAPARKARARKAKP
ncbi:MAG: hypothetical protein KF892_09745 [Rhizobacter sp.]|nr:hypothetical protein [Rhizobacter sp.]